MPAFRVASVIVSSFGFRDPAANDARLALGIAAVHSARELGASLVVLPAGLLAARDEPDVSALSLPIAAAAREAGIAAVFGIDVAEPGLGPKGLGKATDDRVKQGTLPYFLVVASGDVNAVHRQRSTTQQNASLAENPLPRLLEIDGARIALSLCGELFNPRLRDAIRDASPDLVLDVAHSGMGRTFQLLLPKLARESGAWVMNAQHMAENNPHVTKWRLDPAGANQSKNIADARLGTRRESPAAFGLWGELCTFDIPHRER